MRTITYLAFCRRCDGRTPHYANNYTCIVCLRARRKIYDKSPAGQISRKRQMRRYRLKKKYGLTEARWNRMWEEQKGLCAFCKHPMKRDGRQRWSVTIDHDHKTKAVRALVHRMCNSGLIAAAEMIAAPTWVLRMMRPYFKKYGRGHPAMERLGHLPGVKK